MTLFLLPLTNDTKQSNFQSHAETMISENDWEGFEFGLSGPHRVFSGRLSPTTEKAAISPYALSKFLFLRSMES